MIYIQKNTTNDIVLTLSESTNSTNFLFEFVYESYLQPQPIFYWTEDISAHIIRYNQFLLTDSDINGATGSTGGNMNLLNGQYIYRVFGSTYSIDETNYLDVFNDNYIIEEGRMIVSGINTQIDERYN